MKDLDEQKIIEEKFNKNTYKPDAESKKAVMICFYFLSSLIVVFAVLSIWILSLLAKAYEFSETNGKVIAAQIVKTKGNKGKPLFNPKITYEYYINNKTYTASRFDILDFDKGLNLSKQIINDYPVGKEIKVYFNPLKNKETVLIKTIYPFYLSLTPFLVAMIIYWCLVVHVIKTKNYYLIKTDNHVQMKFAYPSATGFALLCAGCAALAHGTLGMFLKSYGMGWSFYYILPPLLMLVYLYAHKYKRDNFKISKKSYEQIIESEKKRVVSDKKNKE